MANKIPLFDAEWSAEELKNKIEGVTYFPDDDFSLLDLGYFYLNQVYFRSQRERQNA